MRRLPTNKAASEKADRPIIWLFEGGTKAGKKKPAGQISVLTAEEDRSAKGQLGIMEATEKTAKQTTSGP